MISEKAQPDRQYLIDGTLMSSDEIFKKYKNLIHSICKHYRHHTDVPYDDLFQSGALGLWRALHKYNPDLGIKFSTYAVPWIKTMVANTVRKHKELVRIPRTLLDKYIKAVNYYKRVVVEEGRVPDEDEVSKYIMKNHMLPNPIIQYISIDHHPNDGNASIEEIMDNEIYSDFVKERLKAFLREKINELPEIERQIVCLRLGFNDNSKPYTFRKISEILGKSVSEVKKIYSVAIETIKDKYENSPYV
ncbi:MAG: sigma-70 family RNA polymerase sigma factor [Methylacidiphilales bacterium]|nr:sigma-70 family RNA polymerase sigma factor [Candidatus Methylacidiphilales bacterium]